MQREPAKEPGMPRWVMAFGVIALVLLVAFVVLHVTRVSPAGHGP